LLWFIKGDTNNKNLKKQKINAQVFVGGSFAKNTVIKKKYYDIDIFVRFDAKYEDKTLSQLTKKALAGIKKTTLIHGSRDYFRIKINPALYLEVVPVRKIKKPKEAVNITDLSYSHVSYIKRRIKSQKLLDDIRIAKAFCHGNNVYGAESYIKGFSGYSIELLVYYYKGFLGFIKAISKIKPGEKVVIDIEKHYKNKQQALMDLNSSKLQSPIILIDPTYKQRNALAALSNETFERFHKVCKQFLKNPSINAFKQQTVDIGKIKQNARRNKQEFILLEARTDKQEGNIAGSKLLKFYNHLAEEISRYFEIKKKGFNYNGKKSVRYFFVAKKKPFILFSGPKVKDKKNVQAFKKRHTKTFTKSGKIYAKQPVNITLKKFIDVWKHKNKTKIKEMSVVDLKEI
ncbi:MAG: nucleotidyltransferase domain-containing protein, partial [Candidatus Nanoarchaeia archaeon]